MIIGDVRRYQDRYDETNAKYQECRKDVDFMDYMRRVVGVKEDHLLSIRNTLFPPDEIGTMDFFLSAYSVWKEMKVSANLLDRG